MVATAPFVDGLSVYEESPASSGRRTGFLTVWEATAGPVRSQGLCSALALTSDVSRSPVRFERRPACPQPLPQLQYGSVRDHRSAPPRCRLGECVRLGRRAHCVVCRLRDPRRREHWHDDRHSRRQLRLGLLLSGAEVLPARTSVGLRSPTTSSCRSTALSDFDAA